MNQSIAHSHIGAGRQFKGPFGGALQHSGGREVEVGCAVASHVNGELQQMGGGAHNVPQSTHNE